MADEKKSWSQKLTEVLQLPEKFANLVKAIISIIASAFTACFFLYSCFANSETSVSFVSLSADDNVLHVTVTNQGLKPSTLRGYRLKFPDLPFDDAPLWLIEADAQKGRVPRRNVNLNPKELGIDDGSVDLGFILGGVSSRQPNLEDPEIRAMLTRGQATVEIDVQEANDPPQGPWHKRSDTFDAARIEPLLMKKIEPGG